MAKVSTNPITSIDQDWGKDSENGLPYSGQAVQEFIKNELSKRPEVEAVNRAVESAISENVFQGEEGTIVTDIVQQGAGIVVTTMNASGTSVSVPMDFSKEDPNARAIQVAVQIDKQAINVGGVVSGSFGFIIRQGNSILSGQGATAQLRITKVGSSTPLYTASLGYIEGSENEDSILSTEIPDLTSILASKVTGNASVNIAISIAHTYTYVDDNGETVTKTVNGTGTTRLTIISLTLNTDRVNIANQGMTGQILIPYTVEGNGTKSVYLYKNGVLEDTHSGIEDYRRSSNFTINNLPNGVTNFQIVAQSMSGDTIVTSSSHYFDLFGSATEPIIAFKVEESTGAIQEENKYKSPEFTASKFTNFKFSYYVYNIGSVTMPVKILTEEVTSDGVVVVSSSQDQVLARRLYTYSKKIKSSNRLRITFTAGDISRTIIINPLVSSINIELPTESLKLNLDADGRSNEEANPAVWSYGDTTTEFEGFNWQSDGWLNDSLVLRNGAKVKVKFPLFKAVDNYPVTKDGCTFEVLFKCTNATLDEHDIISCYWDNNDNQKTGLNITTTYVGVNTGEVTDYTDDNGNVTQSVSTQVGSQYAQDNWYKFTFVINPNAPGIGGTKGLCYGYLNGILSYIAPVPSSFVNLDDLPIVIDSSYADVYVKSIKYYNEPLTHDQCVDEHIIDQETADDIEKLYNKNAVLSKDNQDIDYVSPQKLRAMGRGVMIISPSTEQTQKTTLQDLNKSSNKKSYYGPFRVAYFAPETDLNLGYSTVPLKGNNFNFLHNECAIRIQGTTSTKRPRKNYRLHFNKKDGSNKPSKGSFIVGGKAKDDFKYAMSQGAVEVPIACLKVDFVDSSMTHNTGGAVVFNEMTRNVASLRNPAQIREYKNSPTDIKTRVAIEGFPIDVFAADSVVNPDYTDSLEDSNYTGLVYMGQYNYNNDKSKSGAVFGFDGSYTYDENGNYDENGEYQPICVEFLDNNADLDLFKIKFNSSGNIDEAATYAGFNDALEVRAPEDVTDQVADHGLDSLTTAEGFEKYKYIPAQLKRVFTFIGECAKQVARNNGVSPSAMSTFTSEALEALDWTSEKFTKEASDYFNLSSVCAWYIWTDYLLAVDQRAKNMMMYTMDGKHWMFQYYDGDTVLGERNDCFLAYDYLTDRNTYDAAVKQYAIQGHDSWLWYLLRANFSEQKVINGNPDPTTAVNLNSVCQLMRSSGKFSADYIKQVFNEQFVGNWSQRQYNYSQDYKYIQPLTETGYPSDIGTNFINTAQGSREAHRTYTLENRFNLLDSKYQSGNYTQDAFIYYAAAGSVNKLKIVSSIPYYFGWNTSNTSIREHQQAGPLNNYTITLTITGNSANNPANVLGASRIKELIFEDNDHKTSWVVDSTKPVKLPNLHRLVVNDLALNASGDIYLECPLLEEIDIARSSFSGVYGLEKCSKLKKVDFSGTNVTVFKPADGAPLTEVNMTVATALHLSNHKTLSYKGLTDKDATLKINNLTSLSELLVNNCPNIDWESLVYALLHSSARIKYLRITGIDKKESISWLEQFDGVYGLDENGNQVTSGAQLTGILELPDYTDDEIVDAYRAKYPGLTIKQPEFTMIGLDELVIDESYMGNSEIGCITNFDNNTGNGTGKVYEPSGHILRILNGCHRYLGKLITPGKAIEMVAMPNDPDPLGRSFLGRDMSGTMLLIKLYDNDSNYFDVGYNSPQTRREAPLDGFIGHGEVGVKIPGFWYKGINYNKPQKLDFSIKYTCYSTQEEMPGKSDEVTVITIDELNNSNVNDEGAWYGIYTTNKLLTYTEEANNVKDRIPTTTNTQYTIYRIDVEGYKKMSYPCDVNYGSCCLFTDEDGNIITDSKGNVKNVGELYINKGLYLYNGMPVITTIPKGAKYFFLALRNRINDTAYDNRTMPCDVVLHKGTKFNDGDEMTEANAREWIPDMEPEWCYQPPMFIHAAKACADAEDNLYTSFDNTTKRVIDTLDKTHELNTKGQWFQFRYREKAFERGQQLIDYEANKTIAMLFHAKYGRRSSQKCIGSNYGNTVFNNGGSSTLGINDTVVSPTDSHNAGEHYPFKGYKRPDGGIEYTVVNVSNFLGLESPFSLTREWMERVYIPARNVQEGRRLEITMPDMSVRQVLMTSPGRYYPRTLRHGKYCDICECSDTTEPNGTALTMYTGGQYTPLSYTVFNNWKSVKAAFRCYTYMSSWCGTVSVDARYGTTQGINGIGTRLMFRGNMIETSDVDYFLNAEEWRGE